MRASRAASASTGETAPAFSRSRSAVIESEVSSMELLHDLWDNEEAVRGARRILQRLGRPEPASRFIRPENVGDGVGVGSGLDAADIHLPQLLDVREHVR